MIKRPPGCLEGRLSTRQLEKFANEAGLPRERSRRQRRRRHGDHRYRPQEEERGPRPPKGKGNVDWNELVRPITTWADTRDQRREPTVAAITTDARASATASPSIQP